MSRSGALSARSHNHTRASKSGTCLKELRHISNLQDSFYCDNFCYPSRKVVKVSVKTVVTLLHSIAFVLVRACVFCITLPILVVVAFGDRGRSICIHRVLEQCFEVILFLMGGWVPVVPSC
eukprot:2868269-Amphidinium_carterae.1